MDDDDDYGMEEMLDDEEGEAELEEENEDGEDMENDVFAMARENKEMG
jgi:hypothetical protein